MNGLIIICGMCFIIVMAYILVLVADIIATNIFYLIYKLRFHGKKNKKQYIKYLETVNWFEN